MVKKCYTGFNLIILNFILDIIKPNVDFFILLNFGKIDPALELRCYIIKDVINMLVHL